jgi:hypothetical protein
VLDATWSVSLLEGRTSSTVCTIRHQPGSLYCRCYYFLPFAAAWIDASHHQVHDKLTLLSSDETIFEIARSRWGRPPFQMDMSNVGQAQQAACPRWNFKPGLGTKLRPHGPEYAIGHTAAESLKAWIFSSKKVYFCSSNYHENQLLIPQL